MEDILAEPEHNARVDLSLLAGKWLKGHHSMELRADGAYEEITWATPKSNATLFGRYWLEGNELVIQVEASEVRRWDGSGNLVHHQQQSVENPQGRFRSPIVFLDEERLVFRGASRILETTTETDDEVVVYRQAGPGEEASRVGKIVTPLPASVLDDEVGRVT